MIVYAAILLCVVILVAVSAMKRYKVHAALARPETGVSSKLPPNLVLKNEDGTELNIDNMFVGEASGNSGDSFGIRHGATIFGKPIDGGKLTFSQLNALIDRIVVVDAQASGCDTGLRLRRVKAVDKNGNISFHQYSSKKQPKSRKQKHLCAEITHVL